MTHGSRALVLAAALVLPTGATMAAEGGVGFYLLGSRGTGAGVLPPPGTYFQLDTYVYSAHTSATVPRGGGVDVDLEAQVVLPLATMLWAPADVDWGGARPFAGLTLLAGYKDIDAAAHLTAPDGTEVGRQGGRSDFLFGDPVLAAGLGGGTGPWFWSATLSINVPLGDYQSQRSTNFAFNHWAADGTFALTWMDQTSGWEVSGALGMTVNDENPATNYRTGNEAHFEGSVSKTFANGWGAGLNGYHYQQVTGDSGTGATLGDFKGRVSALGPMVSYNTTWGSTPVSMKARYLREFGEKNRLAGDVLFFTLVMPLGF